MKYQVLKPVVVGSGESVVHHMRGVIEVDDSQAKPLVAAGKLKKIAEPKPADAPKPPDKPAA